MQYIGAYLERLDTIYCAKTIKTLTWEMIKTQARSDKVDPCCHKIYNLVLLHKEENYLIIAKLETSPKGSITYL